jgi:nitrite reductase/ring-hydroxylating ferredoxin subunit
MLATEIADREIADVNDGFGLPRRFYVSSDLHELERQQVFGRAWQYALHEDEIREPGSWALAKIGEYEVIVSRDFDGKLHAMRNVCAHRGARIVDCAGKGRTLRCPYHAWAYNLDGTLKAAPGFEGDPRPARLGTCRRQPMVGNTRNRSRPPSGRRPKSGIAPSEALSFQCTRLFLSGETAMLCCARADRA